VQKIIKTNDGAKLNKINDYVCIIKCKEVASPAISKVYVKFYVKATPTRKQVEIYVMNRMRMGGTYNDVDNMSTIARNSNVTKSNELF